MKLNDNAVLDFIDQDILYCWACPSYEATLMRLTELGRITPDPDIRDHIENLVVKLILNLDRDRYEQLFYQNRLQMEHGVKRKLHFAKELMEMELKEVA